jgi:hypothetical protein
VPETQAPALSHAFGVRVDPVHVDPQLVDDVG